MAERPFFSVVIPTFNRVELLAHSLQSVLDQTFLDVETVVVDNGSSDGTSAFLDDWAHRVRSVRIDENRGIAPARNLGVNESHGQWVAFLDDDDLWLPNHLERHARLARSDSIDWISSDYAFFDDRGREFPRYGHPAEGEVLEAMIDGNFLVPSAVSVRTETLRHFPFNEDPAMARSEDWHLWVRLATRYPLAHIDEITALMRMHAGRSLLDADKSYEAKITAVEDLLADPTLAISLAPFRDALRAHGSYYAAVTYYGAGDMKRARVHLKQQLTHLPHHMPERRTLWLFVKSLFGTRLARLLRRRKHDALALMPVRRRELDRRRSGKD